MISSLGFCFSLVLSHAHINCIVTQRLLHRERQITCEIYMINLNLTVLCRRLSLNRVKWPSYKCSVSDFAIFLICREEKILANNNDGTQLWSVDCIVLNTGLTFLSSYAKVEGAIGEESNHVCLSVHLSIFINNHFFVVVRYLWARDLLLRQGLQKINIETEKISKNSEVILSSKIGHPVINLCSD